MTTLDTLAEKLAQATEELYAGCPTDAMRTLTKVCKTKRDTVIELKGIDVSCKLVMPERTRAELTLRFIELAQRDIRLFQLNSAELHLKEAARLATHTVKLEKLEPWK